MKIVEPQVSNWYRNLTTEQDFEVVAFEGDDGLIEIQYFDGNLEEIDIDSWYEMELNELSAPEDWSGPFEDNHPLFTLDDDNSAQAKQWSSPLESF